MSRSSFFSCCACIIPQLFRSQKLLLQLFGKFFVNFKKFHRAAAIRRTLVVWGKRIPTSLRSSEWQFHENPLVPRRAGCPHPAADNAPHLPKLSLRASDRCHWCGNPQYPYASLPVIRENGRGRAAAPTQIWKISRRTPKTFHFQLFVFNLTHSPPDNIKNSTRRAFDGSNL